MLIFRKRSCTIELKEGDSMSAQRIENILTTLVIALIIQMFAEEIAYLAEFVKENKIDFFMVICMIIIVGLLIYRRK